MYESVDFSWTDKPRVKVTRSTEDILEEDKSRITISCSVDANPAGRVFWRKNGSGEERQYTESLEFGPVSRKDSGTYVCQAENSIGLSNEDNVEIDVLCKDLFL